MGDTVGFLSQENEVSSERQRFNSDQASHTTNKQGNGRKRFRRDRGPLSPRTHVNRFKDRSGA